MSAVANTPIRALTLRLQDALFAVKAGSVRDILDLVPITDLRVTFGMDLPERDEDTRIAVMEVGIDGEPTVAGILADKVHDVTDLEAASIEEAPRIGMRWPPEFVRGIGKRDGGFIIIPNLGRIFETQGARTASPAASEERSAS